MWGMAGIVSGAAEGPLWVELRRSRAIGTALIGHSA
jgi:hypothetical protein